MEEKKTIKISLSTLLLIIAIVIIAVMGCYIYIDKKETNNEILRLESNANEMQNTINDLHNKVNHMADKEIIDLEVDDVDNIEFETNENIKETEDENTNNIEFEIKENNEPVVEEKIDSDENLSDISSEFTENEIKKCLSNYLDVFVAAGSVDARLNKMGLFEYGENDFELDENNYRRTDIEYLKFKSTVLNYVTEEWFNTINYNDKWEFYEFKEKDGVVYYYDSGWSGTEYVIDSITIKGDYSDQSYIAEIYSINVDGSKNEIEYVEFHIEEQNGKCVISYCDY